MSPDKHTLNLAAAVLCGIGSGIALLSALFGRNRGGGAVLPSLLGLAGSVAWAMSAYEDLSAHEAAGQG